MLLSVSQWSSPDAKKVTVEPELNTISFGVCARDLVLFIYVYV